jgi:D-arabinose 1-dehydrogenase-like Zn-dependent alcohol dehydrogenase
MCVLHPAWLVQRLVIFFFRRRSVYSDLYKSFAHNQTLLQFFQASKIKPQLSKSELSKGVTLGVDPLKRRPPMLGEDLHSHGL